MNHTFAVAGRVLVQLRNDRRTLMLIILLPSLLLTLFRYVFNEQAQLFYNVAPLLMGVFPLILMFIVTSIAMLRERRSGTLERLMTMPFSKIHFLMGYMLAFSAVAVVQVLLVCAVLFGWLGVDINAPLYMAMLVAVAAAWLGTALGLFASAFARTEFQAVQFMPALLFPQLLVCGIFAPKEQMADVLQWFAAAMPLTYSVDAMRQVAQAGSWTGILLRDLAIVVLFAAVALVLGSVTIRRSEP